MTWDARTGFMPYGWHGAVPGGDQRGEVHAGALARKAARAEDLAGADRRGEDAADDLHGVAKATGGRGVGRDFTHLDVAGADDLTDIQVG